MKKEPQEKTKKEKVQNKKIESKKEIKEKQDGEAENKKTEKEEKMNKGFFKKDLVINKQNRKISRIISRRIRKSDNIFNDISINYRSNIIICNCI